MRPTANFLTALTMFSALPAALAAQDDGPSLVSADKDTLRAEIQSRYDAALAVTSGGDLVSADDPRFMWASEAKVQCGIALGFLKSGTRDETSIGKCTDASDRMARRRVVAPRPAAPVAPPPEICTNVQPGLLFFDFDSDTPKADAAQAVQYVAANAEACNWRSFGVTGHTDRAGSNSYNDALSMRRAQSAANLMESLGIDRSRMTIRAEGETKPRVPTEDGVRNPQNRRVEITVSR
ncbi:MAG: OmpA family protein [Erythrobacter sp.]|nr:OmpA family protein [Erythrobacter sp.]